MDADRIFPFNVSIADKAMMSPTTLLTPMFTRIVVNLVKVPESILHLDRIDPCQLS